MDYYVVKNNLENLRNINLSKILAYIGAIRDFYDKNKWYTDKGVISVTEQKFINWNTNIGGGGAIDLIMHLFQYDFKTAYNWLMNNYGVTNEQECNEINKRSKKMCLPGINDNNLSKVIYYLNCCRKIPLKLINTLINNKTIYADDKGNAVFLLLGKKKEIVGAELRGTGNIKWHGMAPGSRKDLGAFYVSLTKTKKIIICESAIDAISYYALNSNFIAISTSGINSNPVWLPKLFNKGFKIYCGYDSDSSGNEAASKMINLYPEIKRKKAEKKDWNEVLQSSFIGY